MSNRFTALMTDENGQPIPRPAAPALDASPGEFTVWLRKCNAYNDCVTKRANEAFDRQFRRSLRGDK